MEDDPRSTYELLDLLEQFIGDPNDELDITGDDAYEAVTILKARTLKARA